MITLSLSPAEGEFILQALHGYHDTLLLELSKADTLRFKEGLREREAVVAKVMDQLKSGLSTEASTAATRE